MKLLICTGIYPPDMGGPATYSKLLFDRLPEKGVDVEILSFGEVRHLPKIVRHFAYYRKVKKLGREADLIYVQDPVSVGLPTACACKKINKKFVLKVVGDYAWEQYQIKSQKSEVKSQKLDEDEQFVYPENFWKRKFDFKTELLKKIEKFTANRAEKIITPSNYLKDIVVGWGIDETKVTVIYNVFAPVDIIEEKYSLRIRYKISGIAIFSAGRLVPWKGYDTLIDVVNELPETRLIIAGEGPDYNKLQEKIKTLELENRVVLSGRLSKDDLLKQIKASDIFVLNTGYEGLSHQLLEVMSVGTPIITTNVGGNPELIKDEREGLLIDYNNKEQLKEAILRLSKKRVFADKLTANAKEKLKHFDEEKMLDEL
ncbi:MAG: glycosyltransferase family 4 protein, partial [Candidatus Pacebacteria bacterium]|nr:glycosyltransferase family 4 protein [Candidatus Paceibacterota bacterium]